MNVAFINPFLVSLINVISTMATIDLKPGKPQLKNHDLAKGDVSGLIGMVGPKTRGSLSITFDQTLILEIMNKMLGEKPEFINDEVTDLVGEITNMVTGGAKNLLSEKGYDFDMATPAVVSGKNHTISHKSRGQKIMMPFTNEYGNAFIEICFEDIK